MKKTSLHSQSIVVPVSANGVKIYAGDVEPRDASTNPPSRYETTTVWLRLINPADAQGRQMFLVCFRAITLLLAAIILSLAISAIVIADEDGDIDSIQVGTLVTSLMFMVLNVATTFVVTEHLIQKFIPSDPFLQELEYEYEFRKYISLNILAQLLFCVETGFLIQQSNGFAVTVAVVMNIVCNFVYLLSCIQFGERMYYFKWHRSTVIDLKMRYILLFTILSMLTSIDILFSGFMLTDWA